jgi:hypothetical protein
MSGDEGWLVGVVLGKPVESCDGIVRRRMEAHMSQKLCYYIPT